MKTKQYKYDEAEQLEMAYQTIAESVPLRHVDSEFNTVGIFNPDLQQWVNFSNEQSEY